MNYSVEDPRSTSPVVVPVSVYAQRRRALAEQLRLRGGGVAVIHTSPEVRAIATATIRTAGTATFII